MIKELVEKQRAYFLSHKTKGINERINALEKLRESIKANIDEINTALELDLNKSNFEAYMTETGMVLEELSYMIKHLKKYVKNKKVKTPLAQFKGKSFIVKEPYGVVLIMSPWNYPIQLTLSPLIGAIAGGNTAIIKPSAYAINTSHVINKIINEVFSEEYISVIEGGRLENELLLEEKFDYIFFTGSVNVGKLVMEKASHNLTPVTLELGGKSPCIIDSTANLKLAAKRIIFGKIINSGQTCVAPDYILVDETIKNDFVTYLIESIKFFLGENPISNPDFPKIINDKHHQRLVNIINSSDVIYGGTYNDQKINPTIVNADFTSSSMQEEIFGPILPIITFKDKNEVILKLNTLPKSLALYLFTKNKAYEQKVLTEVSFGGGCVNDTIVHLATSEMGFGGVGNSGMGSYHGKKSFDTFTHEKSIMKKSNLIDLPMRYHPYNEKKEKLVKKFLK